MVIADSESECLILLHSVKNGLVSTCIEIPFLEAVLQTNGTATPHLRGLTAPSQQSTTNTSRAATQNKMTLAMGTPGRVRTAIRVVGRGIWRAPMRE
jgi:hypothetical protein